MENNTAPTTNPLFIAYIVLAVIIGLCYAVLPRNPAFGFFSRIFMFILSSVFSLIGITIGDFLRKIALPDSFFTTGGMIDILKEKLFWFIGPQCIGGVAGGSVGYAIMCWVVGLV